MLRVQNNIIFFYEKMNGIFLSKQKFGNLFYIITYKEDIRDLQFFHALKRVSTPFLDGFRRLIHVKPLYAYLIYIKPNPRSGWDTLSSWIIRVSMGPYSLSNKTIILNFIKYKSYYEITN